MLPKIIGVSSSNNTPARIYHYHIRKTGGTSLNHAFFALSGEDSPTIWQRLLEDDRGFTLAGNRAYVSANENLINSGEFFYGYSHFPMHRLYLPSDTFTITILRDPFERVFSHYKMVAEYKAKGIETEWMKVESQWLGNSFNDFVHNMPRERLLNQLYMFSKEFDIEEAYKNITGCSYFFFTEDFDEGLSHLNKKLSLSLKPFHVRKSSLPVRIEEMATSKLKVKLEPEYMLMAKLRRFNARMKHPSSYSGSI